MDKRENLTILLAEYDNITNKIVKQIIEELKTNSQTYKQVYSELLMFRKEIEFTYQGREKYSFLFNEVTRLLEEEKNDLPISKPLEV